MKNNDDDFEEINLDDTSDDADRYYDDPEDDNDQAALAADSSRKKATGKSGKSGKKRKKKKKFRINLHMVFIALILIVLATVVIKLNIWNKGQKIDTSDVDTSKFNTESMDAIVPLDSSNLESNYDNGDLDILFLGNGSLAENKDSSDNMANIIANETGAIVYNAAIADSYMSAKNDSYSNKFIYDAFSFYYLSTLFTIDNAETIQWAERDLGGLPSDVQESIDLIRNIDYDQLDAICIYYDAHDYLDQRKPYEDENKSNIQTFSGALEAGIKLIQEAHPNIRIIVMSPAYAYYVDSNDNYVSSFDEKVVEYSLYIYVIHEQDAAYRNNVSFVDNFYGSIYEEIANDYLVDNILLNSAGNKLLADRFIYALNRFNDYDFSAQTEKAIKHDK